MESLLKLGLAIAGLLSSVAADLYFALVLTLLWGWFLTPIFGVAVPHILPMWGLALLATAFQGSASSVAAQTSVKEFLKQNELDESFSLVGLSLRGAALTTMFLVQGFVIHVIIGG